MNIGRLLNIPKRYFAIIIGVVITVAILPPIFFIYKYWDNIEFSPPIFINEWLKLAIPSIVIVLTIEYFIVKYEANSYKKAILPFVKDSLYIPTQNLILKLNQYTEIGEMSKNEKEKYRSIVSFNWYSLLSAKAIISLFALKYTEDQVIKKLEILIDAINTDENKQNMDQIIFFLLNNNQNIALLIFDLIKKLQKFIIETEIILKHLESK